MSRLKKTISFSLISIVLFLYYLNVSLTVPINSDTSSIVLMADAMTKGNLLLNDWYLSTGSYYTTELLLYSIFVSLFGLNSHIVYYISSLLFLGVVWCAVVLSGKNQKSFRIENSVITFSLLAIPSQFVSTQVFSGPMHISSLVYVLLAYYFLEFGKKSITKYFLYALLTIFTLIGDPFVLWFFVAPVIITNIIFWIKERQKEHLYVILVSILSYFISKIILLTLSFNIPSIGSARFVEFDSIKNNLLLTIKGMLALYDANFFGGEIKSFSTIKSGFHFILLVIIIYFIYKAIKSFKLNKTFDKIYVFLLCGILINLIEYMVSNMPIDLNTTRYLFPMYIYISIFVGRYGLSFFKCNIKKSHILIVSLVIMSTFIAFPINTNYPSENKLVRFLSENNLKYGYGSYWNSMNLTVASQGLINVYPVISDGEKVSPFRWLSYEKWYENPANFIVFKDDNWGQINQDNIIKAFGEPMEKHKIDEYEIFIWENTIVDLLNK